MTDEQGRVLDMLAEGKITSDEAQGLLAALSTGRRGGPASSGGAPPVAGPRERVSVVLDLERDSESGEARDDTFEVGGRPGVVVNNTNGGVECAGGADGQVRVQAKLRNARSVDYRASQDGDRITVDVKSRRKPSLLGFLGRAAGADIVVTAPRMCDVELQTANGAVEASGFEGSMAAHSVNGEISLEGITGDYDVGTTNGGTAVSGCKGAGILRSVNGAIDMEDVRGSVDVENVNGAISYSGEMTGGGKNRIQTVNGAVGVKLVGSPSLTIDAASAVGGISSGLPGLTASGLVGKQMAGTLGDGEAELKIRTASGSITIE